MTKAPLFRRCRPLLGTFVEIGIVGGNEPSFRAGFDEVNRLEKLLSRFIPTSEIARCNKLSPGEVITLSSETFKLLSLSTQLEAESGRAFCIQSDKSLPSLSDAIKFLKNNAIEILQSIDLDLGGIAKGFIVDSVSELLTTRGEQGIINAGGDLRVFGNYEATIYLRSETPPFAPQSSIVLKNQALASSGGAITESLRSNSFLTQFNRAQDSHPKFPAVSILGNSAMICDALTKIVAVHGRKADALLERYHCHLIVSQTVEDHYAA